MRYQLIQWEWPRASIALWISTFNMKCTFWLIVSIIDEQGVKNQIESDTKLNLMLGTHLRVVTEGLAVQYLFKWLTLIRWPARMLNQLLTCQSPITETVCLLYVTVLRDPFNSSLWQNGLHLGVDGSKCNRKSKGGSNIEHLPQNTITLPFQI